MRTTLALLASCAAACSYAADRMMNASGPDIGGAIIMQGGPDVGTSATRVRRAPGLIIIEKSGKTNRAVIIQQD